MTMLIIRSRWWHVDDGESGAKTMIFYGSALYHTGHTASSVRQRNNQSRIAKAHIILIQNLILNLT